MITLRWWHAFVAVLAGIALGFAISPLWGTILMNVGAVVNVLVSVGMTRDAWAKRREALDLIQKVKEFEAHVEAIALTRAIEQGDVRRH